MISYLSGTIIAVTEKYIVIDTGGVGYKVFVAPPILQQSVVGAAV